MSEQKTYTHEKNTSITDSALVRRIRLKQILTLFFAFAISIQGCQEDLDQGAGDTEDQFPLIQLPPGFEITKVADMLDRPTSVTWDDEGNIYVLTAEIGKMIFDLSKKALTLIPHQLIRSLTTG